MAQQPHAQIQVDPALGAALNAAASAKGETVEALTDRILRAWLCANGHPVRADAPATPTEAEEVR